MSQKIHHRIIQKKLHIMIINKYLKKDIYISPEDQPSKFRTKNWVEINDD